MSEDWERRCLISRVRVLALRGQAAAGGAPTGRQLRRAVAPVLGDLLPLWAIAAAAGGVELDVGRAAAGDVDVHVEARRRRDQGGRAGLSRGEEGLGAGPRCF